VELLNQVSPVDVHGLKLFSSAVGIPQAAVGPPSPSTSRDPVLDIYCALITIEKGRDVFEVVYLNKLWSDGQSDCRFGFSV
jgi:hypothetical protein